MTFITELSETSRSKFRWFILYLLGFGVATGLFLGYLFGYVTGFSAGMK